MIPIRKNLASIDKTQTVVSKTRPLQLDPIQADNLNEPRGTCDSYENQIFDRLTHASRPSKIQRKSSQIHARTSQRGFRAKKL